MLILLLFSCSPAYIPPSIFPVSPPPPRPLPCSPTHSLAPVPIQFHGAPHHCPARQHVLIPLNILAQGRKKQMGKQPAGFAFLWGRQRETAVT